MKKKTTEKKKLQGNAGRRNEEKPLEVEGLDTSMIPKLEVKEVFYFKLWAHDLVKTGKLNNMTLPDFLTLIKMRARLDIVNEFLDSENTSLLQETINISVAGVEHKNFKESPYAKMSRDLTALISKQLKDWGLTGGSGKFVAKPQTNPMDDFLNGK